MFENINTTTRVKYIEYRCKNRHFRDFWVKIANNSRRWAISTDFRKFEPSKLRKEFDSDHVLCTKMIAFDEIYRFLNTIHGGIWLYREVECRTFCFIWENKNVSVPDLQILATTLCRFNASSNSSLVGSSSIFEVNWVYNSRVTVVTEYQNEPQKYQLSKSGIRVWGRSRGQKSSQTVLWWWLKIIPSAHDLRTCAIWSGQCVPKEGKNRPQYGYSNHEEGCGDQIKTVESLDT